MALLRILCVVCTLPLLATPTLAADDDITGVYRGEIWSAGKNPGTTIFTLAKDGGISGTYVYEASNGSATGELKGCWFEVRLLRCMWQDKYGKGDFIALFAPDYRSFEGSWYEDTKERTRSTEGGNRWTGVRTK